MSQEAVDAIKELDRTGAKSFITCDSDSRGEYKVVCRFKTMTDMHEFHRAIILCGEVARLIAAQDQADRVC